MTAYGRTIEELLDTSLTQDNLKADHAVQAQSILVLTDGTIKVPPTLFGETSPMVPTEWCWRQMLSKLGPVVYGSGSKKSVPYDYLQAIGWEKASVLVNEHLSRCGDREWLVREYNSTARACLGDGYVPIQNTDVLDTVKVITDDLDQNGKEKPKLLRSWVTPDRLAVRIVIRGVNTPAGHYGTGVFVENGETGNCRMRMMPFVMRTSCTNSTIYNSEESIDFVHRGDASIKSILVKAKMVDILGGSMELLNKMVKAEEEKIPSFDDVIDGFASRYGWSADTKASVLTGTEGKETRAGLVHGVTYAAQYAAKDLDTQVEMEKLGGRILDMPQGFFSMAARQAQSFTW